jgi:predicted O-methyltransferase YrrM
MVDPEVFSLMKRKIKDALKGCFFAFYKLALRLGFHVLPDHYYVAVPNILELEKSRHAWARKSELPGIPVDLDEQARLLRRVCLPFSSEYVGNAIYREAVALQFGPGYGYVEAQALHAVIRHYRPERIVEVGSGVSTHCMLAASACNQQESGRRSQMTCIERYPSPRIRSLAGITLLPEKVQSAPRDLFAALRKGDLLFIDSSHTVKPGGEVNYLILEVLPRLNPGVLVHFHDIYFPYDYQPDLLETFLYFSETSLLRAFLIGNQQARILFCLSHLHYERQEALRELFPEYDPWPDTDGLRDRPYRPQQHFPSSLYLEIQ